MSEIRQNILTGEWTIYAANRNGKPYDFIRKIKPREAVDRKCPFCPGNEHMTTEPVYSNGEDGKWNIRVFPNMYPAVSKEDGELLEDGFYTKLLGIGLHEVVVDTDSHDGVIHDFSKEHIAEVIRVLKDRFSVIKSDLNSEYVQVFKNCGSEAGASINHSHWQIIGCQTGGIWQVLESKNCGNYFEKNGSCLMCDMLRHEKEIGKRIVAENEFFKAFVPYAGKMAFELFVVSERHFSSFDEMSDEEIEAFADIMKVLLDKVKRIFNHISYNICFQDSFKGDNKNALHWYARILPRIGAPAGYEFATGTYINPILPETAAKKYREL